MDDVAFEAARVTFEKHTQEIGEKVRAWLRKMPGRRAPRLPERDLTWNSEFGERGSFADPLTRARWNQWHVPWGLAAKFVTESCVRCGGKMRDWQASGTLLGGGNADGVERRECECGHWEMRSADRGATPTESGSLPEDR